MSSPSVERALELVNRLEVLVPTYTGEPEEAPIFRDLRSAIRALGGSEWLPPKSAIFDGENQVRLLVENVSYDDKPRLILDASLLETGDWYDIAAGETLEPHLRPLAWKPADSTELPAELEAK